MEKINSYDLSRSFFNWCFENPEKITPTHIAMYFFIIEHCNRLGWKEKFGLPTTMVKDAIGIRNFRTYTNTLHDLVEWGFVKMIEVSKNQYSSNIIAIVNNAKANTKALDKALQKHSQKQSKSIDSINKQETINKETIKDAAKAATLKRISDFKESLYPYCKPKGIYNTETVKQFFDYWSELNKSGTKMKWELQQTFEISKRLATWVNNEDKFNKYGKTEQTNDHIY